jgi:hypothetical protein
MVSNHAMALASAIWLTHNLAPRRHMLCLVLACLLIGVGCAGIYVENRNPIFKARSLSHLAVTRQELIRTDPRTYRRGRLLLRTNEAEAWASSEPPTTGSLFLFNPNRVSDEPMNSRFRPASDWRPIEVIEESPKLIARFVANLDLADMLHPSILRRLLRPNAPVTLFRVGQERVCRA